MTSIKIEVRGLTYPVEVSATGVFSANVEGALLRATTLDALREKAVKESGHRDLGIPFTYLADPPWYGTVRRLHATNRNILVTREGQGGGAVTVQSYDAKYMLTRLSDEEFAELQRLQAAKRSADAALQVFREAHERNMHREIREAQAQD